MSSNADHTRNPPDLADGSSNWTKRLLIGLTIVVREYSEPHAFTTLNFDDDPSVLKILLRGVNIRII
jgi:hypothetical protein